MNDANGITPVMPIGNGGDWGGNGFMWIFGLLILMGMFNGNGWGNNGSGNANAIQADVNRGFDNQNQTFHDSLAAMQNLYNETARDIAALSVGQANLAASQRECCCNTQQAIMQNNYDAAMRDAATNANFTAQIQSVKDMIAQNKIEALQQQVNALQLKEATAGVLRYPNAWTYTAGAFPPIFGGCPNA